MPSRADDPLRIGGRRFESRLVLGTGGFRSLETMAEAIAASGTEMVTLALRRVDPAAQGSIVEVLDAAGVLLLPASVYRSDSPLQRLQRDIEVLKGHVIFDWDRTTELAGRTALGIEPRPTDMI